MNPIRIEQSQEEMKLAFEVHRNAAICAVRLCRSKLMGQAPDEPPKGRILAKFTVKSRSVAVPKGKLRVEIDFRMAGEIDPAEAGKRPARKETVVCVECTYALDYQLREGFEPSTQQIKSFKDGNAIFNCWPYFREYLQESVQRMGFPPLTAPFLRVETKPGSAVRRAREKANRGEA